MQTVWTLVTLSGFLLPGAPIPQRKPPGEPVAMILDGTIRVKPPGEKERVQEREALLYEGDALTLPKGRSATISVLGTGLRQHLSGPSPLTVGPKGCPPSPAVKSRPQARAIAESLKDVGPASDNPRQAGRNAGSVLRDEEKPRPAIVPIHESTIDNRRPVFSWPESRGATSYRLRLQIRGGQGRQQFTTTKPRFECPGDRDPLRRNRSYTWWVDDQDGRRVVEGTFRIAGPETSRQLEELKPFLTSDDPADVFAAAWACERLHFFDEAIAGFEALVKLTGPDNATDSSERTHLERLLRQAGKLPAKTSTP